MASFCVLIAFLSLKRAKNEGEVGIFHGKARLKLNYTNNPSFGELRSLFQINQVCKEENHRRNLTSSNFAWLCETPKGVQAVRQRARPWKMNFAPCAKFRKPCETKIEENEFRTLCKISRALWKSSCIIFRYLCTNSIRFLSSDILCNFLFSPCN